MNDSRSEDVLARARRSLERAQALKRQLAEVRDHIRLERLERDLAAVEEELAQINQTASDPDSEPEPPTNR